MEKALKVILLFLLHIVVYVTFALALLFHAIFFTDWETMRAELKQTDKVVESAEEVEVIETVELPEPSVEISKKDDLIKILDQDGDRILIEYTETGETRWVSKEDYVSEFVTQRQGESTMFLKPKMGPVVTTNKTDLTYSRGVSKPHLPWFLPSVQVLLLVSFIFFSYRVFQKPIQ